MLHRPGQELENLMPEYLERLLFDDIPYLRIAQEEHNSFADILRQNGVEVVYLSDLVAESIINQDVKEQLIQELIDDASITTSRERDILTDYFRSLDNKTMIAKMMAGIRKTEIQQAEGKSLGDFLRNLNNDYPFVLDPMPNLYFTRDPFASIGNGVSIHRMFTETRHRETLFAKFIFEYHPLYKNTEVWYDRSENFSLEGGDILILNKETIAIGISQRTHENAIEKFAQKVLTEESHFKKILAINIPKQRTFMHLDTVFTMVDYDKFTIHPNIMRDMDVFVIERDGSKRIRITQETSTLEDILKRHLHLDHVTLIKCGSNNVIDSAREQWNDGSNTLAIAPGEVIVYSRNYVTNEILQEHGVKTYVMPSSELSRGRGGPRCMSMPLIREDL
ncbi:MAG: arginine deiminase [Peptococcaceae bacterium]|nr:arginine deiminase [Peptococcaceae bacterium]MBQ5703232.1 arginine deiminase [Peptococcaceae bacterium]MBQ5858596.1 arginine deiminase [Peptococcaceae bacterium]